MPVPPHAHQDAPPGASVPEPHPVIAAAYAAAHGRSSDESPVPDPVPARHKAPLRPPSRRAWAAVGLLVALTALPMLVVIFAGRAALRGPDAPLPYRADGDPHVVIEPGPDGSHRPNDATAAPEASGAAPGTAPSAPAGAVGGVAGGGRTEATPCPTASGAGAAQAAGGGAAPAGGGSPGGGPGGDGGSGAPAAGSADAGGASGGAPATGAPGGASNGGADGGSGDDAHGGSSGDDQDGSGDEPAHHHSRSGSTESSPGRNFIERVFDDLGIPLP